jgi:hypothetical protein
MPGKKKSAKDRLEEVAREASELSDSLAGLRLISREQAKAREAKALLKASEIRCQELADAVACYESLRQRPVAGMSITRRSAGRGPGSTFLIWFDSSRSVRFVSLSMT